MIGHLNPNLKWFAQRMRASDLSMGAGAHGRLAPNYLSTRPEPLTLSASPSISSLPTERKLLLGGGVALLITTFLPWYSVSIGGFSASANGWHQLGTLAWLILIAVLVWEGARVAGVVPVDEARANLITAVGGLGVLLFGVIFAIQRLADGSLGFGFFLGVIALAFFGFQAVNQFNASGGKDAVTAMQRDIQQRQAQQQSSTPAAGEDDASQGPPAPPAV